MQPTELSMKPLANHTPVTHHDGTDKRIGTDTTPPTLSKLQRSREMPTIRACQLRIHRTD